MCAPITTIRGIPSYSPSIAVLSAMWGGFCGLVVFDVTALFLGSRGRRGSCVWSWSWATTASLSTWQVRGCVATKKKLQLILLLFSCLVNRLIELIKKLNNNGICWHPCSDPSWGKGGGNCILKWVFFVQSIFADQYVHRRELRLVSLESSSNVEHGIEKIFLIFVFYRELSRFKLLKKVNSRCFIHIFA